ncbi:MAG TPA: HAD-IIIA family hydrolase [Candidatus Dormibacteraeota bacterium]
MPRHSRNRAVFLDRDGVMNPPVMYAAWGADSPTDPDDLTLYPDAARAVRTIHEAGFLAILASNQPGVAKRKYSLATFDAIDHRLTKLLADAGAALDAKFYCLHHPTGALSEYRRECECRKPKPGMLREAAAQFGLDLATCYFIGDSERDFLAAEAAGCKAVVLARESNADWVRSPKVKVVKNLDAATREICGEGLTNVA